MSRAPIHSQHRIVAALQLGPMSPQQLEVCLQLSRRTVTESVDALECRGKVKREVIASREYGAWPEVLSLATAGGQR